ncbi:hypothetical protein ABTZ93_44555 [Streptomyces sp. NPDC097941]|uniref:hypothetical protein n=1 Tax=Streptomyces sp. NPDC097941 TaxID=3155685 RepID=UPI00331C81D1
MAGDELRDVRRWWFWGDSCLSRESYHPNKTGTTAYAQAFMMLGPAAIRQEDE